MVTTLNTHIVLDLGTSAIKAACCNNQLLFNNIDSAETPEIKVSKGQCISDAMAYLDTVEKILQQCKLKCISNPKLGLCYQRSSFLLWDCQTGQAVTPLISWQDNRGKMSCKALQNYQFTIKKLTGLPLTPYFFAPKVRTLLQQQPELREQLLDRKILIGTLDSFLIWQWTDGQHFVTDASMAARTLLMDIHTGKWSETLSDLFNIPVDILPTIHPSCGFDLQLNQGTVLQTSLADQSAAILASIDNDPSEALINLGTGGFVARYKPESQNDLNAGYLNTLIYQDMYLSNYMAVEGTVNSISDALKNYPCCHIQLTDLAEIADIFCLAEPSGIGAPFFRSDLGITFSKDISHLPDKQIACMLLEAILFRLLHIFEDFNQQQKINRLFLSGGLSSLPSLQQGLSLFSQVPTYLLIQKQAGLMGVAMLTTQSNLVHHRQIKQIVAGKVNTKLIKKYQHWKTWLEKIML